MSTLSIAPAFDTCRAPRSGPRPSARPVSVGTGPVRLTRRGRVLVVLAFLGLALVLMTVLAGRVVATNDDAPAASVRVVTVAPGDTLFTLAGRIAEPGHVREMVTRIQELNSLPDTDIEVGQQLAVPRG